ncbi:MAG: ABC transporter substrate-binding protein, partial [Candidatus Rokuibacteriota bacterium]
MSLGRPVRAGLTGLASALLAVAVLAPSDAKVLRTNLRADPAMVDPVTYSELVAGDVMKNLYEGFTDTDKDGNVVPALALKWEAHPDNKGFRFQLRKGVKFHSGREFTAKDVKWTFEQILLPGNKGGLTLTYLKDLEGAKDIHDGKATQISGVKVVDPYTVEVRFVNPDVLFPIYPFQFMDSGIVAQHGADWSTKVSAGTGPFKFVHWKRGQEVRLAAHKEYWGGAPLVDEVAMLIVPSYDTAVSMYEANALDVIELEAIQARRVLKDPQFKDQILAVPAAQIRFLGMNQNLYEPFKDKRVREAICLSFDREGLVKGLYGGAGAPLYGQITPGVAGYNPNVKPIPYDPARAKRLMADAGYPDGKG